MNDGLRIVIVPKTLEAEINRKLAAAYADYPAAEIDRENHYQTPLGFFDQNGYVPDFTLRKS